MVPMRASLSPSLHSTAAFPAERFVLCGPGAQPLRRPCAPSARMSPDYAFPRESMKTEVPIQPEPATAAGGYIRRVACVLVPVSFCACALGIRNEEVAEQVESGQIRWAFDMAQPGARARCLRIWVQSLDRYRAGLPDPKELTEEAVINDVLGTRLLRIRASNLGVRCLSTSGRKRCVGTRLRMARHTWGLWQLTSGGN